MSIITILIILMIGAGTVYYYGRQILETPGPLREDKIVNIPSRAGKRDIADARQLELSDRRQGFPRAPRRPCPCRCTVR